MNYDDYDILTDRYLNDELNSDEKKQFEEKLKTDKALRDTLRLHKDVDFVIQSKELLKSREMLEKIRRKRNLHTSTPYLFFYKHPVLLVAASLLIIIGIVFLILISVKQSPRPETIFKEYYMPFEMVNNIRITGDIGYKDDFYEALNFYKEGRYNEAAEKINVIPESYMVSENSSLIFLSGLINIETDNIYKAEQYFLMVLKSNDKRYYHHAQWYLALIYLKDGKLEDAKVILFHIIDDRTSYLTKAYKILTRL